MLFFPIRSEQKKIGPWDVNLIRKEIIKKGTNKIEVNIKTKNKSKVLFIEKDTMLYARGILFNIL